MKNALVNVPFCSDQETTFCKVTELGAEFEFMLSVPDISLTSSV